ncbi:MAG: NADP-dependent malic enzyme [Bacteroidia bacterium]|nr:NADP-dependent malic enzyme [Bacteroidia bacterium]
MGSKKNFDREALNYHEKGRPGKLEVIPSKETANQRDLSLAYSPGVAAPCLKIAENSEDVYKYTAKGNLVAVISNGTAVLGLGDIGPEASKPVMEGKGLLFKIYADIDCFDIELDTKDVDEFVRTVKILEPTFGGINLEDISAPECFEIEERLKQELNIPVMHDDQHGTAIISAAALLNALEIVDKKIEDVSIIVNGAGAAAISCSRLYNTLGAKKSNIFMFDSKGLLHPDRDNLDGKKAEFTNDRMPFGTDLKKALANADVFIGLSIGNIVSKKMVKSMADNPIVFAMANPDPEISYDDAKAAREDVIMATGRSDYPNQVNNVLGFPYIFRGALDVGSNIINEEMKAAAVRALAELAKKPVPDTVSMAYNNANLSFGPEYIIPKPVDPRLITEVAPAVAKAAIDSGVANRKIKNWDKYRTELSKRLGLDDKLMKIIHTKARQSPKTVVFADAENVSVLKAAQQVAEEKLAQPILLGDRDWMAYLMKEYNVEIPGAQIIHPRKPINDGEKAILKKYGEIYYDKRKRKGVTQNDAHTIMKRRSYYGAMMVEVGAADAMIGGLTNAFPDTLIPALHIIGSADGVKKVAGMYILKTRLGPLFLADTTINLEPNLEELIEITELAQKEVEKFNIQPRIALVTYSNFGSITHGVSSVLLNKTVKAMHERHPDWIVDGEMQAHLAFNPELRAESYPFSKLGDKRANTLIFPNLSSSNIAYNLLKEVANIEKVGPILMGLKKPVHILQYGSSVREIVDMVALAVVDAQGKKK